MSNIKYRQCSLQNGNRHMVSWIPSKFAISGKILKLRDENKEWEDGWEVISAGTEVDEEFLPDTHQAIKNHWKKTSGSIPVGHK